MNSMVHEVFPSVAEAIIDSHIRGNYAYWFVSNHCNRNLWIT